MNWTVIIAYTLTVLMVYFGGTSIPAVLIGGLTTRLHKNILLGMLTGAISSWIIIDFLWRLLVDGHIPVLLSVICFLFLGFHQHFAKDKLNDSAKMMMNAEMWAILIICIYTIIVGDPIRWY